MTAQITLDDRYTATVETARYGEARPVIVVFDNGRRTPGQWFAETLVERGPAVRPLDIDSGAGWTIPAGSAALLYGFAVGVLAAVRTPDVHTREGIVIGTPGTKYAAGIEYGQTHDMDCPGCQSTPFTASPRSETYWAS